MADQQPQRNLFSTLKRLFSTDVIIKNDGGTLKTVDTGQIQVNGVLQTNALHQLKIQKTIQNYNKIQ